MNETNLSLVGNATQIIETKNFFTQNIAPIFSKLGDWLGQISGFTIKKGAEVGLNIGDTTAKVIALIILLTAIYFSMMISKKGIKWALIILWIILIASIVFSF